MIDRLLATAGRIPSRALHVVSMAIAVLSVLGSLASLSVSESAAANAQRIAALRGVLGSQSVLEWRAASVSLGYQLSGNATTGDELAATRARFSALLAGLGSQDRASLAPDHDVFSDALESEVALIEARQLSAAHKVDTEQVAPAHARLDARLALLERRASSRSIRASWYARAGVGFSFLFFVFGWGLLTRLGASRLRRQERYHQALAESSTDLVVVSSDNSITYTSPSVLKVTAGDPVRNFVHPDDLERLAALKPGASFDVRIQAEGVWRTYETQVTDLTHNPHVRGMVWSARDVTTRNLLVAQAHHRSRHDLLTGLPNRTALQECAASLVEEHAEFSVLLLDLDGFKAVNDTLGHVSGDKLLSLVASRLRTALMPEVLLTRLGGDEFAVLVPGAPEHAQGAAALVLDALEQPLDIDGAAVAVSGSIGLASYPSTPSYAAIMQRVDMAMYAAKSVGGGLRAWDDALAATAPEQLSLLGELRTALAEDQLVLHYQPKVDLSTGSISGVEALVRWEHPTRGLLYPGAFMDVLEQTTLIHPLTERVLEMAARQAAEWMGSGLDMPVAVNLSGRNLSDLLLVDKVSKILAAHGLPADRIELELTETALLLDPTRAGAVLAELSALGCKVALDDFGAGYTSISQLESLPVDVIKVDRVLVDGAHASPRRATILAALVGLAHSLELKVVAEGVEDVETLDLLRAQGYDHVQGYYLAKPGPASLLTDKAV